jgi:hypothetical protein
LDCWGGEAAPRIAPVLRNLGWGNPAVGLLGWRNHRAEKRIDCLLWKTFRRANVNQNQNNGDSDKEFIGSLKHTPR